MYSIELAKEQQAGFDYQANITRETVQVMLQRIINEVGISYYEDLKRVKSQGLMEKVNVDPVAYEKAVNDIFTGKIIPSDIVVK